MKKIIAFFAAAAMLLSLSACSMSLGNMQDLNALLGGDDTTAMQQTEETQAQQQTEETQDTQDTEPAPTQPAPTQPVPQSPAYTNYQLTEVGTIQDTDRSMYVRYEGLLLADGQNAQLLNYMGEQSQAGTITSLEYMGNGVYMVRGQSEDVNAVGLADREGNLLIPFEACSIQWTKNTGMDSDRYLLVIYALEKTENKDECFIYFTDSWVSFTPDEDDVMYTGYGRIYDIQEKSFVGDIKITNSDMSDIQPCGDNLLITDEEGTTVLYNAKGENLFQTVHTVEVAQDAFIVRDSGTCRVYDANGNQTYTSNNSLYVVEGDGGYIYGYSDGKYFVMDSAGNLLPGLTFDYISSVSNGVFNIKNGEYSGLVKADGTVIVPCDKFGYIYEIGVGYYYASYEDAAGNYVYALMNENGIIAEGMGYKVETLTDMQEEKAFVVKDAGYTLALETSYPDELTVGLISASADSNGLYGVFDLLTGEQLLGYEYETIEYAAGYLYAFKNGAWTVYQVNGPDFK